MAVLYQGFIAGLAAISRGGAGDDHAAAAQRARAALVGLRRASRPTSPTSTRCRAAIKEIGLLATVCARPRPSRARRSPRTRPYAGAALVASVRRGRAGDLQRRGAAASSARSLLSRRWRVLVLMRRQRAGRALGRAGARRRRAHRAAGDSLADHTAARSSTSRRAVRARAGSGPPSSASCCVSLPLSQISGVWLAGEYRAAGGPRAGGHADRDRDRRDPRAARARRAVGAAPRRGGSAAAAGQRSALVLLIVLSPREPVRAGQAAGDRRPRGRAAGAPRPRRGARPARAPCAGVRRARAGGSPSWRSDVLAYSYARVAPTGADGSDRRDRATTSPGRGWSCGTSSRSTPSTSPAQPASACPFEALTPAAGAAARPTYFYGHYFDLDEEQLVVRGGLSRSSSRAAPPPPAVRPPTIGSSTRTRYYLGWRRTARPQVLEHLPEQQHLLALGNRSTCPALRGVVADAPAGSELVAPVAPELAWFEPLYSTATARTAGGVDPEQPGRGHHADPRARAGRA